MKLRSLEDLYVDRLRRLYDAENRLLKALPKFAKSVTTPELRAAFDERIKQACDQADRLERILDRRGRKITGKKSAAMKGLIREGRKARNADCEPTLRDAALIAAAQKIEHCAIAAYGCLVAWANQLGRIDEAELLRQTLKEARAADERLNHVAEGQVNRQAEEAAENPNDLTADEKAAEMVPSL
jgi:ferritin-like metal-binding protein YciE